MSFFVCLLDTEGYGIPDATRRSYEAHLLSRNLSFQWREVGQVPVLIGGDGSNQTSLVAYDGEQIAFGTVRLDNRADVERWSGCGGQATPDLELVLRTVGRHGADRITDILGDFAVVVWHPATKTGVAARDAFGVKRLYYAARNGVLAFASLGDMLALDGGYDEQYLAELVALCVPSPGLSVYAKVRSVAAGTTVSGGPLPAFARRVGALATHRPGGYLGPAVRRHGLVLGCRPSTVAIFAGASPRRPRWHHYVRGQPRDRR